MDDRDIRSIVGKTIESYRTDGKDWGYCNNLVELRFTDGTVGKFYHNQDCCEGVELESIDGDLDDLVGYEIKEAYVSTNSSDPKVNHYGDCAVSDESSTWTFYIIRTTNQSVTLRFYGSSNGYYSEDVDFILE